MSSIIHTCLLGDTTCCFSFQDFIFAPQPQGMWNKVSSESRTADETCLGWCRTLNGDTVEDGSEKTGVDTGPAMVPINPSETRTTFSLTKLGKRNSTFQWHVVILVFFLKTSAKARNSAGFNLAVPLLTHAKPLYSYIPIGFVTTDSK